MSDALIALYTEGLKELAVQGVAIKNKIRDAKTSTKVKYYKKKAKQNSEKAARLLVKLERLSPGTLEESTDDGGDKPTA